MPDANHIAALVETLPPTDAELKTPTPKGETPREGKFTGPAPDVADQLCRNILDTGPDGLNALLDMVRDPAEPAYASYKPEYLVHCLTLFAGRPGLEKERRMLAPAMLRRVQNEDASLYLRLFLIRELQWIGDASAVPVLAGLLTNEELADAAAATVVSIGTDAAPHIRRQLPDAKGRVRLVLLQALGQLRDPEARDLLRAALKDEEPEVRIAAAWGLARLGDDGSIQAILRAADGAKGWERMRQTGSALLLAEQLSAHGNKDQATAIYIHLRDTRTEPHEAHIRDAARRALGVRVA